MPRPPRILHLSLSAFAFFALAGCPRAEAPSQPRDDAGSELASAPAPSVVDASSSDASALLDDAAIDDAAIADAAIADAAIDAGAPEGMLLVPGGTFKMGADRGGEDDEHPAHDVTVASFWLDATEITQAAYDACVHANACPPPAWDLLDPEIAPHFRGPNRPVVLVAWSSVRAYCTFMGKRLPSEAEFERAVRGDDGRRFPWGDDAPTKDRAVFEQSAPEDVGTHRAGRGPYGHDDLTGNVWEWTEDDYDPFAYSRSSAPSGKPGSCDQIRSAQDKLRAEGKQGFTGTNPIPTECEKSIRGGAYNFSGNGLRSTNRVHHAPRFILRMTGGRCAKDA